MQREKEIPNKIKEYYNFDYMTIRKLDINKEQDKQLVNYYQTKVNETAQVEGRFDIDAEYFTQIFKLNVDS